ncbi:MAG: Wzz/FepE/Etk N-terminal domain-containing protein [Pseudomonadota bacterium]
MSNLRGLPVDPRPDTGFDSDLHELWLAARRQVWVVGICTFIGLVAGGLHYATSPREYEAGANVMIEQRLSDLEQELSASLPLSRNDTAFQNEIQILQSQQIAIEVVRALSLHENDDFLFAPQSALGRAVSSVTQWAKAAITPEVASTGGGGSTLTTEQREERRIINAATCFPRKPSSRVKGAALPCGSALPRTIQRWPPRSPMPMPRRIWPMAHVPMWKPLTG